MKRTSFYTMVAGEVYCQGYSQPLLKCLDGKCAQMIIAEMHEGICKNHAGNCALMAKILQADYLWPIMKRVCLEFVQKYDKCQRFGELKHSLSKQLHCSETSWPFHKQGIDILSPFPLVSGQLKYFVVAISYFTKWIKANPLATITREKVGKFMWKRIIYKYGVPHHLVSNNGT